MKPVSFKGQNIVFGEGQPQYEPLPAIYLPNENGQAITCWELTDEELEQITKTKRFYLSQLTFNQPLQPILPAAELADLFRTT